MSSRAEGRAYCFSTTNPERVPLTQAGSVPAGPSRFKRKLRDTRVYIITSAQNATPVHPSFWRCLQTMARHRSAELLVIPIRYKNPTSAWTNSQANAEIWAEEVTPYLWNVRKALNENLVLLGDIKTQPTASDPLGGFDSISGASSGILGHTKVQMRCIPTPSNRMPKVLTTTGACTLPNYTDSKAGKLGAFHHSLSAVVVEVSGRQFFLRQLNYDTRTHSFTDLDTRYHETRWRPAPPAAALVMGDTHVDSVSKEVERATFGKGGIVEALRPRQLVWHDLLDGYAVNPHHAGNPFIAIAKRQGNRSSIAAEVGRACRYVHDHTPPGTTSVVVPSNHNDFLRRWVLRHDWRDDPENAEFYLRVALEMVRGTRLTSAGASYPDPLALVFPTIVDTTNIRLLHDDESYLVKNIELGMHGDRGPNGARGSIRNHSRIGVRSVIGHSHTPGVSEGAYQVGTSTELRLEYTNGPSSWLNAHCVINDDGKRQILIIVDGKYRI